MTVGSLFAGIGGLDLGLERAGMIVKWQVELDDYATKVLEKHWPDVARYGDVRECGAHTLAPVDLICGGFPCQDVSLAGKRTGLKGKRTTLWSEFARLIRELEPRWVLAENVPGLLSSDDGRFFGNVLRDLAACGYDAEWDCIPAAAVGAPHRRYRVFIVAYAKGQRGRRIIRDSSGQGSASVWAGEQKRTKSERSRKDVADASSVRCCQERDESWRHGQYEPSHQGGVFQSSRKVVSRTGQWAVEPDVGRVAHGIPSRVDRLRCLGNAVVPQVAEWVGRRIMDAEMRQNGVG